jgi:hypothetical protein
MEKKKKKRILKKATVDKRENVRFNDIYRETKRRGSKTK